MIKNQNSFLFEKDPLLSWSDLVFRKKNQPAVRFGGQSWHYAFVRARNALYHSLAALNLRPGERVLVPAYICAAAVSPLLAYGAKVDFYKVGWRCNPDFLDLEAKIGEDTRATVLIHYFGFSQNIQHFLKICRQHRLFLIEDCAHVLYGEIDGHKIGSFGDAAVFSWRKFLPLYDGADLLVNRSQLELEVKWIRRDLLSAVREWKHALDQLLGCSPNPLVSVPYQWAESVKNSLYRFVFSSGDERENSTAFETASFDLRRVNQRMSRLSEWIMGHLDIRTVIERRQRNFNYLLDRLSGLDGLALPFAELGEGVCPWVFPLSFHGMQNGHLELRRLGIPAVTWGGVRHSVIPRGIFPEVDGLYENLIFLPVHQDLKEEDLSLMVEKVRERRGVSVA